MDSLDLLVLADLHYAGRAGAESPIPERRSRLALELAGRAVRQALRSGRPDALLLAGDIVENGAGPGGAEDLAAVRDGLAGFGLPVFAVPGNHDGPAELVARVFGAPAGVHRLGGYRLAIFADVYGRGDVCTRPPGAEAQLLAAADGDGPLIAAQHNPVLPHIGGAYPYNVRQEERLAALYARAGAAASVSGHYHPGIAAFAERGVTYFTCPALCQAPFRFARLRLEGRRVAAVQVEALAPAALGALFDVHVHTELAVCAEDVTAAGALSRAALFGLGGAGLSEHADQLYFPREEYRRREALAADRGELRRAAAAGLRRMDAYRALAAPFRARGVPVGLEVEPASDGPGLALLDEDRGGWDYLLGAVHSVPGLEAATAPEAELARGFLAATERVLAGGVDVLAHPFRLFRRAGRPVPAGLSAEVAALLAARGAAAEINFHTNEPEPEFFALCLERGVKLATGSDAHALAEAGALLPHLELLRRLGVAGRLAEVLWRPAPAG